MKDWTMWTSTVPNAPTCGEPTGDGAAMAQAHRNWCEMIDYWEQRALAAEAALAAGVGS